MKVKDLKKVLEGFDDDEDVFFTQERYDYAGTIDICLVTRAHIALCLEQAPGNLTLHQNTDHPPDEDDVVHEILVLSN